MKHAKDEEFTETVPTHHGAEDADAKQDVVSDPALDDRIGSDWSEEGGATPTGPATTAPPEEDDQSDS